ncbi:hypothetical protein Hdeb2414_s0005g00172771 [Helianthus debilis subsp. tardiflorus]
MLIHFSSHYIFLWKFVEDSKWLCQYSNIMYELSGCKNQLVNLFVYTNSYSKVQGLHVSYFAIS